VFQTGLSIKIGSKNEFTEVTGPCATVQYGLIMLTCGCQKMESRHDGKPISGNAELRTVRFGSVIGKPKPNHPTVFHRLLMVD